MQLPNMLTAWVTSKKLDARNRTLSRSNHEIGTFRCSEIKPPKVQGRSLMLFHKPKTVWFALQVVFFCALAVWTIKAYVHVIKSF